MQIIKGLSRLCHGDVKTSGRTKKGRITSFHRGGGKHNKNYLIDFSRAFYGIPYVVREVFYDVKRTSKVALICYENGVLAYILAPHDLKRGDFCISGSYLGNISGYSACLMEIPSGTFVFNLEKFPGSKSLFTRSAGCFSQILKKFHFSNELIYVLVKLSSGEIRYFHGGVRATIGLVSNIFWQYNRLSKAGDSRIKGRRPVVRGVAKNPVDHPHGGGEGRSSGGRKSVTPWGILTKGYKTRRVLFPKSIVRRRNNRILRKSLLN